MSLSLLKILGFRCHSVDKFVAGGKIHAPHKSAHRFFEVIGRLLEYSIMALSLLKLPDLPCLGGGGVDPPPIPSAPSHR
jgi:hypothetical protein